MGRASQRTVWLVFVFSMLGLFVGSAGGQQRETLAEVLARNSVPFNREPIPNLDLPITSYAVLSDARQFMIAYYLAGQNDELRFPLYLARFDKRTAEWRNSALRGVKVPIGVRGDKQFDECIGSVLAVQQSEGLYYLNLHWTPSAACLLVLNQDFSVITALPGWTMGFVKGGVLWERNMIHFASTHPEELWMYQVATGRSERLYPPPDDPLREDFSRRLAAVIDPDQCRERNWACDPHNFSSEITDVVVNQDSTAVGIRVGFSPEGFLTDKQIDDSAAWYDDQYVYIFRLSPFAWRAFSIYDLQPKFGTESISELLTADKLRVIFHPER
jgi:hypothetical protein